MSTDCPVYDTHLILRPLMKKDEITFVVDQTYHINEGTYFITRSHAQVIFGVLLSITSGCLQMCTSLA